MLFRSVGRRAADLYSFCKPIAIGSQAAGDLAFYDGGSGVSHVVVVVAPPDGSKDGHSPCFGASGSGSGTVGQYSDQCVKEHWSNYWGAFKSFGRVPLTSDVSISKKLNSLIMLGAQGKSISALVPGLDSSTIAKADSAIAKL